MLAWNNLVEMLGCSKANNEFIYLPQKLNELPVFEEGVLGDRSYYSFFNSGILFLLEDDLVNQISLYMQADEGFSIYTGELPLPVNGRESEIIRVLGVPSESGGGKMDMLLGYINRWIKYKIENYTLHIQFDQNDKLCRVTLMQ
ncbi:MULTISPECIES: hypothetical protein [Pectobacteriaceae]|uniref:Uncharacterized protein n=2 Tax=Pectobacteriaceae TaxID=1903410 RepID=A0A1X3RRP7_9GAMM|nr:MULTISPECIES: hypothetical protein [Pectobacteriaceae]MCL2892094.1 hypothetical protein [Brenneria tiliae]OSN04461.1 hypothetical protein AU511_12535 [Lonsdalea iberica]